MGSEHRGRNERRADSKAKAVSQLKAYADEAKTRREGDCIYH